MPDLFIPSSTGTVFTPVDYVKYGANGTDVSTGYVTKPVPGQILQTRGLGEFVVHHIGTRGSLTAEVITGPPGEARALIKLTSELHTPRDTVQLSLDSQNRPVVTIAYNDAATITASGPGGPAIPAGQQVQVRVVWDAVKPLANGRHVDFRLLSGQPVPGNMGNIPKKPWPMAAMRGIGIGLGTNLFEFNGTVLSFQVGEQRM